MRKQIFIEIANLDKKIKKLKDYLFSIEINNYIITEYGKYLITDHDIVNITNIPNKCHKHQCILNDDLIDMFINTFENQETKIVSHIPLNKQIIKTEKTTYKLNKKSNLSFIIEKHILVDNETKSYDLDFNDKENNVLSEYYFILENDNEYSHFFKEDISSFLKHLN